MSRYQKVQARKAAQAASDARFFAGMTGLMGLLALLAILLGAIMLNGAPQGIGSAGDMTGLEGWMQPWLWGHSKLEYIGGACVGLIGLIVFGRLYRRK